MWTTNFRRLVFALLVSTAGLGVLAALSRVSTAQTPENLRSVALQRAAQRGAPLRELTVVNSVTTNYRLQGKSVFDYKVMNNRTGAIYSITLDGSGREVNSAQLQASEQAAHVAKYGRLEPALAERLASASTTQPLEVIIWLKEPSYNGPKRSNPNDNRRTASEVAASFTQVDAQRSAAVERVVTPVASRLRTQGYNVKTDQYAPALYARLKPNAIREIAQASEVDKVYLSPINKPTLDIARQTIGVPLVNQTFGITGAGIRVGEIEVGGRIATNNPNLSGTTQDTTYVCSSVSGHSTAVAGVIRSTHSTVRGVAPGALLWAGGSCSGSGSELQNRSTAAADWGARVLNLSWGSDTSLTPGANDRFYDGMVINRWRTVVVAAGNTGGAGCKDGTNGNVWSPGLGYNVLTVGNFDDRNTFLWNDDVMNSCSNWRNPKSTRGDRQKPEVAAPGTDINTTTNSSPWTGAEWTGTSFSAPMVTGTVALLLQTNSGLTDWPEAIRAILMTSALHNVEGSTRLSEYDGAGGIDASWAYYLAKRSSGSNWGAQDYTCSSATDLDVTSMSLSSGKQFRATITWDNDPSYSNYSSQPSADLDLQVIGPSGTVVASSASYDNTYEIVDFTPSVSGTYKLRVKKYRCDYSPKYLGWAWQVWQQ
jgi:hypothetical protein